MADAASTDEVVQLVRDLAFASEIDRDIIAEGQDQ